MHSRGMRLVPFPLSGGEGQGEGEGEIDEDSGRGSKRIPHGGIDGPERRTVAYEGKRD